MLKTILYIIFFIIFLHIIWFAYVKLKNKFWSMQPVFHYYQWWYWIYPIGILNKEPPEKNRYVNLKQIITNNFESLDKIHLQNYLHLIKKDFLNYKEVSFNPSDDNILDYFKCNNAPSYFTFFFQDEKLINEKKEIVNNKKMIGGMTSRGLNVFLKNKEPFVGHYVDYLCVDSKNRKQNIAPQVIQTHVYNTTRINKNVKIFLFKKDYHLNNIVPLTLYLTKSYDITEWNLPTSTHPTFNVLELNDSTLQLFYEFIDNNHPFKCYITCNPECLLHLLKTKNIYGYIARNNNNIVGVYLFRNSTTTFHDYKVFDLFFTLMKKNTINDFLYGFEKALFMCYKKETFKYLSIENISHNNYIMNMINSKNYIPFKTFPTAYYFYNYINKPYFPNDVAIIH